MLLGSKTCGMLISTFAEDIIEVRVAEGEADSLAAGTQSACSVYRSISPPSWF